MTTGVPAARLSQNLFGVESRWFSELAGTAMIETSADAAHDRTSSGWTGGRTTCRPANRALVATSGRVPRPTPWSRRPRA